MQQCCESKKQANSYNILFSAHGLIRPCRLLPELMKHTAACNDVTVDITYPLLSLNFRYLQHFHIQICGHYKIIKKNDNTEYNTIADMPTTQS